MSISAALCASVLDNLEIESKCTLDMLSYATDLRACGIMLCGLRVSRMIMSSFFPESRSLQSTKTQSAIDMASLTIVTRTCKTLEIVCKFPCSLCLITKFMRGNVITTNQSGNSLKIRHNPTLFSFSSSFRSVLFLEFNILATVLRAEWAKWPELKPVLNVWNRFEILLFFFCARIFNELNSHTENGRENIRQFRKQQFVTSNFLY